MFFILSKTIGFLTMPLVVVCLCFLISVFTKRQKIKRAFFWIGFGLLFFFSNGFIANEVIAAWEINATPFKEMRKYKLGIVLTGSTLGGRTPNDRVYFGRGADRVTHTVQLYKLGLIDKILISGGSGSVMKIEEKEAVSFQKAMVLMGIPEGDIIIESDTRNTHESAVAVKKILTQLKYEATDCILITSAFHMRRSLACYRKAGLKLDCFSTDFYTSQGSYNFDAFLIPSLDAFEVWHKLVREWTGFAAYKMAGYL